jgi:hypothetical protein
MRSARRLLDAALQGIAWGALAGGFVLLVAAIAMTWRAM